MILLSTIFILLATYYVSAVYVEAMVGNSVVTAGFKPQIAMRCGYFNQYYDRTGVWLSDSRGNCLTEAKDILEYCRSVYPDLNVTNVMESGALSEVENWCQPNEIKCDKTFSVAPYRCLEGNFQSEALLVPESCIFDHVHNGKACLPPAYWLHKAQQACSNRAGGGILTSTRRMTVRASSMLLPCKVGQFSGVEFVCCPSATVTRGGATAATSQVATTITTTSSAAPTQEDITTTTSTEPSTTAPPLNQDDHAIVNGAGSPTWTSTMAAKTTKTAPPTLGGDGGDEMGSRLKAYLEGFDKGHEHQAYVEAKKALRDKRRQNIVRIMEEWGMSEHRYQKLKETDPLAAEQFKKDITDRFQKTITALEDEETAQKKQLIAVHEQRVTSMLNEKKRDYMFDFLGKMEPADPPADGVRESLQRLLRTEEKDKMHVIHYYEHLLNTDPVAAGKVKSMVAQHVTEIEHRMERSVKMLSSRHPKIYQKIYPQIKTYLQSIKTRNGDFEELTRSITNAERPALDTTFKVQATSHDSRLLLPFHLDNEVGVSTTTPSHPVTTTTTNLNATDDDSNDDSDDVNDDDDDQDDDDYDDDDDDVTDNDDGDVTTTVSPPAPLHPLSHQFLPDNSLLPLKSADYAAGRAGRRSSHSYAANKLSDQLIHAPAQGSLGDELINRGSGVGRSSNQSVAFAWIVSLVAIAAFALIIVGLVLVRRKMHFNHPHNQHQPLPTQAGKESDNVSNFVEVDNQSLEERHLANMQVNGYENPTYRYFEKIAPKA